MKNCPCEKKSVFWESWYSCQRELLRICMKMMNGADYDAEDALSTALIRALDKFPAHAKNISNLKGWLIQLTRNVCIDIIRKRFREEIFVDNNEIEAVNFNPQKPGTDLDESPESTYFNETLTRDIYLAVEQLPPQLRETFVLRFFNKMSYRDIALYLCITNENARKRIQKVRKILKSRLNETTPNLQRFFALLGNSVENSPSWSRGLKDAEEILNREYHEIGFPVIASSMVPVSFPSGIERSMYIFLRNKPSRPNTRIKTLRKYVALYSGGWKKRAELAELLTASGKWNQAIRQYLLVLKKHPQTLWARLRLGELLMKSQREKEAAEVYKNALPYARKQATKYHFKGMTEICEQQFEAAGESFEKAASLDPGNEIHWQKRALVYQKVNRHGDAVRAFEKALEINPQDMASLAYGWESLIRLDFPDKAGEYVDRVLNIFPSDVLALKRKTDQRCRMGLVVGDEGKETRNLIRKMKKLAPGVVEVDQSLALYYFYRGEPHKSIEVLKTALREKKNCPDAWYYYACWLYRTGAYRSAADALLKAYRLYKNHPRIYQIACEILSALLR